MTNHAADHLSPDTAVTKVTTVTIMSPSQRSISVGNIADCATEPLVGRHATHVSCDNLDKHVRRVPPPPPPRLSSLQRAPSQAVMYYTTVPQSLVTRTLGSRHQPTRSSLRHSRMLVLIREGRGKISLSCSNKDCSYTTYNTTQLCFWLLSNTDTGE